MKPQRTKHNNFDITIKPRDSKLVGLQTREIIHYSKFKDIYRYRDDLLNISDEWNEVLNFEKYQKSLRKNKNQYASVQYGRNAKYGRVYAKHNNTILYFRKQIRNTLCNGLYYDIDIENCHPTILYQICDVNFMKTPCLQTYVENRNKCLWEVIEHYNTDRQQSKNLFLRLLNSGSVFGWRKQYNVSNDVTDLKFVKDFELELNKVCDVINEKNVRLKQNITDCRLKKDPFYLQNIKNGVEIPRKGYVLSYFLNHYEEMILEKVFDYLVENRYIINNECVLCFDGIMFRKTRNVIIDNVLKSITKYIYNEIGFDLDFSVKDMNDTIDDELKKRMEQDKGDEEKIYEIDVTQLRKFNIKYMFSLPNYLTKKKYFETFFCKVLEPEPKFIYKNGEYCKNIFMWDVNDIRNALKPITIKKTDPITNIEKTVPFVEEWFSDINMRIYDKCEFVPYNNIESDYVVDRDIFNLFTGFNPDCKYIYDERLRNKIIKPFLDLTYHLCEADEKCLDFYIKFIANIIQEPTNRPPIAFVFTSKQGEGKNLHLEAISNVMGKQHYITTSSPNDILGDHAEGIAGKLIINFNETEQTKESHTYQGKMKSIITEPSITVNPKNVRPYQVSNFARTIIFSNKSTPISVDFKSRDRRYVFYKASGEYIKKCNSKRYDRIFWSKLAKLFNSKLFISALYDYLMEVDCSNVNWIGDRPLTETYYDCARNSIPLEVMFLEELVTKDIWDENILRMRTSKLHEKYLSFLQRINVRNYQVTPKKFMANIKELQYDFNIYKNNGHNEIIIHKCVLLQHLNDSGFVIDFDIEEKEIIYAPAMEDNYFIT